MKAKTFHMFLVLTLLLLFMVPAVIAAPAASDGFDDSPEFAPKQDNKPDPLTTMSLSACDPA